MSYSRMWTATILGLLSLIGTSLAQDTPVSPTLPALTHERAGEDSGGDYRIGTGTRTADVVGRRTWGAHEPVTGTALSYNSYDKTKEFCSHYTHITVHHTHGDYDIVGLQKRHQDPGFFRWLFAGDETRADVAYHFFIDLNGRIYEGRPLCRIGAHSENDNTGNIGIVLRGDFESNTPDPAQIQALEKLVRALIAMCPHAFKLGLFGHKERKAKKSPNNPTECPGANLQPEVERIARELGMTPK